MTDDKTCAAVVRGLQLFHMRMGDLPHEALIYAGYLCKRYGMCGETMLTAFCTYAQIVEGLDCDDDLYLADARARQEWAIAQREWERYENDGRVGVRPKKIELDR